MAIRLQATFSAPSQPVRHPKAEGYNIRIGNDWFRTVSGGDARFQIGSRDSLAQRNDDTGSTANNVLDLGYSWARTDYSGGEGLDWDPRELALERGQVALDQIRFWDSENIDVRRSRAGNISSITISREDEVWNTFTDLTDLTTSDKYFFIGYGVTLEWWDDWDAGSEVDTATASLPIVRIEASGAGDVAVLVNDGTIEYLKADTNTLLPLTVPIADVQRHWFAKGRFIAHTKDVAGNSTLVEFDEDGIIGSPFLTFQGDCLSMVSSGPAVVGAFSDGTVRTFVPEQSNALIPESVNLVVRGITDMPSGEVPFLLGSNADVLIIQTRTTGDSPDNTLRLYQAEVLDARFDYVVGQLQLRREWFDTASVPEPLKNMSNTRDEIWFIVHESPTEEMVWRFDVVTSGLSRHLKTTLNVAHSIIVFDDRAGFVSLNDLHRGADTFAGTGWLITPNITFGLNTDITWLATVIEARDLLESGAQVELYRSSDPEGILDWQDPSWVLVQRLSSAGGSNVEVPMVNLKSRTLALQIRIVSSSASTIAPQITRTAIRGIPAHRDTIMMVPINVSDYVSVPGRKPNRVPGLGHELHSRVLSLVGQSVEAFVLDPPMLFRGIVNNISEPVEYLAQRGSVTRYCMVEFRGQRLTATATPTGDSGMGLGLLGISTVGIGQTEGIA